MIFKNRLIYSVILILLYLVVSTLSYLLVMHPGFSNDSSGIIAMFKGDADLPFARRVLAPLLIRTSHKLSPEFIDRFIRDTANKFLVRSEVKEHADDELADKLGRAEGHWDIIAIGIAVNILFLMGFLGTLRYGLRLFYGLSCWLADLAPLLMLFILPIFYYYPNMIYDYAQLFLFALGYILIARGKLRWYYLLLFLAALNKETAVLLPLLFLVHFRGKLKRKELVYHLALQIGLCVSVYLVLYFIFRANSGVVQEVHFLRNFNHLTHIGNYFIFTRLEPFLLAHFGVVFWYPAGLNIIVGLLLLAGILYHWAEKPLFLRKALLLLIPLVVASLVFGFVDEMRVYYELVPIVFWLIAYSVARPRIIGGKKI